MIDVRHLNHIAMEKRVWNRGEDGKNYIIMEKITTEKAREVENCFVLGGEVLIINTGGPNQRVTSGQDC